MIIRPNKLLPLHRLCWVCNVLAGAFLMAGPYASGAEPSEAKPFGLDWFRDARFGLFIHWGIYSVPAGEWEGHKNYAETIQLHTKMFARALRSNV